MLLKNLSLILMRPRFPENIGMVARACANIGCENLLLVQPENFNVMRAAELATPKGVEILNKAKIFSSLQEAVGDSQMVWGSTARKGGWRKEIQTQETAAREIAQHLQANISISLVMGNEKYGLDNDEIKNCSKIVHIPLCGKLSSLNLAQASLLLLYECAKMVKKLQETGSTKVITPKFINVKDLALLEDNLKNILLRLQCVQGKNPDYHFMQWHNMLCRAHLRRHEFDAWMGLCRQINLLLDNRRTP